ncbi:Arc family DNA binding domain-containing protein [Niabella hirudinis]|uniref:Arc family DNA binding domain-containing protein n=1 Tax=Niabella hirudinis TaxID=1285929 RepID=UPI003EBA37D5
MKDKKRFILRIDQSAFRLLEQWAADEFRSVNGQIEYLLQRALMEAGRKRAKTNDEGGKPGAKK